MGAPKRIEENKKEMPEKLIEAAKNALEKDDPRYVKYFGMMSNQDIIRAYRHIKGGD